MLHKAFNPPKIYIKSLSGIPSEFLPRHAAAHRRSGTGSRLWFVLPCRFGFCFTVYYNKCRWDAQSVRVGFRRFFRLKIGFFSMRHRLSGVLELPLAGSPYPGGSFFQHRLTGARELRKRVRP
jgi:hypothetical protein